MVCGNAERGGGSGRQEGRGKKSKNFVENGKTLLFNEEIRVTCFGTLLEVRH